MIRHWYETNLRKLSEIFGGVSYDRNGFNWIMIRSFPLPPTFHQSSSALLIVTPGFNIENYDSYKFYLDLDLTRRCHDREKHLFKNNSYNDLYEQKWSRLSFHLKQFRPTADVYGGDNLIHMVQSIYNFLGQRW